MFTRFLVILNRVAKSFSGSHSSVVVIVIAKYKHTPPLFVKSVHTTPYLWNSLSIDITEENRPFSSFRQNAKDSMIDYYNSVINS